MKTPAFVLIPSILTDTKDDQPAIETQAPEFEPVHPLARKLRHILSSPEKSTIGDMAEVIEQLMGELAIMGPGAGGPPPQPMPQLTPAASQADEAPTALSEDEKLALGNYLMAFAQRA